MSKYDPKKPLEHNVEIALFGKWAGTSVLDLANRLYLLFHCIPSTARAAESVVEAKKRLAEESCKAIEGGNFQYFRDLGDCLEFVKGIGEGQYDQPRAAIFYCLSSHLKKTGRKPTKGELKKAVQKECGGMKIEPRQWTRYLRDYGLGDLPKGKPGRKL